MDAEANSARLILPLALMIEISAPRWARAPRFTAYSCLLSSADSSLDWGRSTPYRLYLHTAHNRFDPRLTAGWRERTPLAARRLSLVRRPNQKLLYCP